MHRSVERKVKEPGENAAAERAPKGFLQIAAAEGQEAFRIRKEEPRRKFVRPAAELAVPVAGELVVGIFSRTADHKRYWIRGVAERCACCNIRRCRKEIAASGPPELITLEVEQRRYNRIDARNIAIGFQCRQGSAIRRRDIRNVCADECSR